MKRTNNTLVTGQERNPAGCRSFQRQTQRQQPYHPSNSMMLNVEVQPDKLKTNKPTDLWKSYRRKNTRDESEAGLVEQYMPLVKTVVGRLQMSLPSHVDAEDLYSAG